MSCPAENGLAVSQEGILAYYDDALRSIDKDYWEGVIDGRTRSALSRQAALDAIEAAEHESDSRLADCIRNVAGIFQLPLVSAS